MAVAESTPLDHSTPASPPPLLPPTHTISLLSRIVIAAAVLSAECLAISWLSHYHWPAFHTPITSLIVLASALFFFGRSQLQAAHLQDAPLNPRFALLHAFALALIAAENFGFTHFAPSHIKTAYSPQILWAASILLLVFSLTATLFPLRRLLAALRINSWFFAALLTLGTMSVRTLSQRLWSTPNLHFGLMLQQATFTGVKQLLGLFYNNIVSFPEHSVIGTVRFKVLIADSCSGIEGLALMLIFTLCWLIVTRRELRLKRALLLVPIALCISWLLNIVRIATLIAIGDAGHPAMALKGFHSEAGWVFFNAIALAFLLAAEHLSWLRRDPLHRNPPNAPASAALYDRNLAAPYLLPFLAVLATSLLTHAFSSGFEALYPLRFVVALLALWWYRADYRRLHLQSQWHFGWLGPLAGAAVFALWIALAHLSNSSAAPSTLAAHLAQLPTWQRVSWITLRAASAVLTVPIVEELAFRGYIARRVQSSNIDSIPFAHLSVLAILVSSVAFGALHGRLWIAGILSGIVFALVAKFRNRLGEAIAAHATANLLIVLWVLTRSDYSLW